MIDIVQKENPVLRKTAEAVPKEMFGSPKLTTLLETMKKALAEQDDGVAIAAPQVGASLRIFVVSKRAFTEKAKETEDTTFINPEIISISKDKKLMPEGCLSVRWLYGNARRASRVKVRAQDEKGVVFERTGTGLLAQIFQHEIDHLNGILFTDHAKDIKEIPPESLLRNHD